MKFRPRFSLRTLLIVVALAAVTSWAYWIGWPWWQLQRERWQIQGEQEMFEACIKDLKAGLPWSKQGGIAWNRVTTHFMSSDPQDNTLLIDRSKWPNAIYCICYTVPYGKDPNVSNIPCASVRVFRIPPAPPDYKAKTYKGDNPSEFLSSFHATRDDWAEAAYMGDFVTAITIGRNAIDDFKYELIYADPPAKQLNPQNRTDPLH